VTIEIPRDGRRNNASQIFFWFFAGTIAIPFLSNSKMYKVAWVLSCLHDLITDTQKASVSSPWVDVDW
jgi:hypothetical protein